MPDDPRPLTKSDFRRGLDCIRRVWLDRWRPELRPAVSPALQDRFDIGKKIGELAWRRYPEGRLSAKDVWEDIRSGAACLFEAAFASEGRKSRLDVIWKGPQGWVVDEVKMGTAKPLSILERSPNVFDLGFQVLTARRAGLEVETARLVMVDGTYVWSPGAREPVQNKHGQMSLFDDLTQAAGSEFDAHQMLTTIDLTVPVGKALPKIDALSRRMIEALAYDAEPQVEINIHCKNCDYSDYCLSREPEHSVIYLPKIKKKEVDSLRLAGHYSIPEIPDEYGLPEKRLRVRDVIRSGEPFISPHLAQRLEEIAFPAVFIDYESTAPTFPIYPGTRPYEAVCFQWSAHLMAAPEAETEHYEFLADGRNDPREEFCQTLWRIVENARSIVHYSSFEIYQLKAMAEKGVPLAEELHAAILARTVDLEQIVDDHVYFANFKGKTSIKVVLPVLVPELGYADLEISDGEAATVAFRSMIEGRPELRQPLLDYCKQDTLAMVEIYRALRALAQHR